jgi:hypothetical protein
LNQTGFVPSPEARRSSRLTEDDFTRAMPDSVPGRTVPGRKRGA